MTDNIKAKIIADSVSPLSLQHTTEFNAWVSMKQRCYNENHPEFFRYGEKGILVSSSWLNSFETFLSDMGCKPCVKLSLDRIDSYKGYSAENCRWADKATQSFNQRVSIDNKTGITGVQLRKQFGTYRAYITVRGKRVHLGSTDNLFDACCIRKAAENYYYGG